MHGLAGRWRHVFYLESLDDGVVIIQILPPATIEAFAGLVKNCMARLGIICQELVIKLGAHTSAFSGGLHALRQRLPAPPVRAMHWNAPLQHVNFKQCAGKLQSSVDRSLLEFNMYMQCLREGVLTDAEALRLRAGRTLEYYGRYSDLRMIKDIDVSQYAPSTKWQDQRFLDDLSTTLWSATAAANPA